MSSTRPLTHAELLQLKRWNTPTIYNGWEQITRRNFCADAFNLEETRDFMPQMGPMAGYAVTVVCEPGSAKHKKTNPNAWSEYRRYIASLPGPKIVVVQIGKRWLRADIASPPPTNERIFVTGQAADIGGPALRFHSPKEPGRGWHRPTGTALQGNLGGI